MEIKDVEKLAELARIELSLDEKKELLEDMGSILDYVSQIKEVAVNEKGSEYEHRNVWREDQTEEKDFSKELLTDQFPESQDGFLKVKKIL